VMEHHEFVLSWRINVGLSPALQLLTSLLFVSGVATSLSFSSMYLENLTYFLWAFWTGRVW
jgi:hypothetical protein